MGKLGEEEDEEGEPAIERRSEYTGFRFDLDKRNEQIVCHASALAMTNEVRWEWKSNPGDLHYFCKRQQKPWVFH